MNNPFKKPYERNIELYLTSVSERLNKATAQNEQEKLIAQYETLYKTVHKEHNIKLESIITAATYLACTLLILNYEDTKCLTSKAFSALRKP